MTTQERKEQRESHEAWKRTANLRPMPQDDNDDGYDQHRDRMLEECGPAWKEYR